MTVLTCKEFTLHTCTIYVQAKKNCTYQHMGTMEFELETALGNNLTSFVASKKALYQNLELRNRKSFRH